MNDPILACYWSILKDIEIKKYFLRIHLLSYIAARQTKYCKPHFSVGTSDKVTNSSLIKTFSEKKSPVHLLVCALLGQEKCMTNLVK